jgi:hypothetical protein
LSKEVVGATHNPMNTPVMSEFRSVHDINPQASTDLEAVIKRVQNCPDLKARTRPIRVAVQKANEAGGEDTKAKQAISERKKKLPLITPSGVFTTRNKSGIQAYSGIVCGDLDHLGDQIEPIRDRLLNDNHLVALFRSPSGTGLKLFYRVGEDRERHPEYFDVVAQHIKTLCGAEVDPATRDIARACYLCHDEGAVYRPDALPLPGLEKKPLLRDSARTKSNYGKLTGEVEEIQSALNFIDPAPRENWLTVGMALHQEFGDLARSIWDQWSQKIPEKYDPADQERTWSSFHHNKENTVGIGTVFHMAREAGWTAGSALPAAHSLAKLPPLSKADDDVLLGDALLCRGKCMVFVASTGIGKSTLLTQAAMFWATGRPDPALNLMPSVPLKILHLHAESDLRDIHRMRFRVLGSPFWSAEAEAIARTEEAVSKVDQCFQRELASFYSGLPKEGVQAELVMMASEGVFVVYDELRTSGKRFIDETLGALLEAHQPDLVILDPLLGFYGGDVNSQEESGQWLRCHLGPVLEKFGCGCILVAHTSKPSRERAPRGSLYDYAYASLGSVEWSNYPRSILALEATKDPEIFVLRAAKRGADTGWRTVEKRPVFERTIRRASMEKDGWSGWKSEAEGAPEAPGLQVREDIAKVLGLFPDLSVAKPPFKEEEIFRCKRGLVAAARELGISKDRANDAFAALEADGRARFATKGPRNQHWFGLPEVVEAYKDYNQKKARRKN